MRPLALPHWPLERWERVAARSILLLWAAFWIWFGLVSGIAEHLGPAGILIHTAAPGAIFAGIVFLAWRYERTAGALLLIIAALILLAYDSMMGHRGALYVLQVGSILAGPPAIAGFLFLAASKHPRP